VSEVREALVSTSQKSQCKPYCRSSGQCYLERYSLDILRVIYATCTNMFYVSG
jgi:hypothetical protein